MAMIGHLILKNMAKEKEKKVKKNGEYSAKDISVLEGLEPVRRRPGMYIGTTGTDGLHHLIWEIFDNSRDEAMGGFADTVEVALLPNNRIRVVDNGRGIPIDIHKKTKVSALETIMTTLHAGGKFGGEGYKISGGLHGVGASVVNALSIYTKVEIHRDGGKYVQEYSQGKKKANVKKISPSKLNGSIITFEPDIEIFKEISFNYDVVLKHLRQQAYLVKGMKVIVIDAREYEGEIDENAFYLKDLKLEAPSNTFYFEGGLLSLIKFYNQYQKTVHKNIFYVEKDINDKGEGVEVSLQYTDDISARIVTFANNIPTIEGGMHLTGFKSTLTRTLNNYARKSNFLKEKDENFTGDDVLEGITAVVSIKLADVQFEGQTKAKLGSVEARGMVETVFGESFSAFLEEKPDDAKQIINKVMLALRARKAARAAKDSVLRKGALEGMTLPGKLADCQSKSAEESELFIVEGDSAGGCFSGDTKVALLDGRNIPFRELVKEDEKGKKNYCYTIGKNGNIKTALIENPRITKKSTEVIKVILDNDEEIICTPDHRFMLRDGKYKEAKDLIKVDSLMPLRRQLSRLGKRITIEGYELVFDLAENRWIFTHLLSDKYNLQKDLYSKNINEHVHHLDFNKLNNNPDNLKRLSKEKHLICHTKHLEKTLHTKEAKAKAKRAHQTLSFRKKMSQIMSTPEMKTLLSKRAKKQWQNDEYKEFMKNKFREFYQNNSEYRESNKEMLNLVQEQYWGGEGNRMKQSKRVTEFFEKNPERKDYLSSLAKNQWSDEGLLKWRSNETKQQWTDEFRTKRKEAYNKTYLRKALSVLKTVYEKNGVVNLTSYEQSRQEKNDRSIIRYDTICKRFFDNNERDLVEAVKNFNHKIKKIVKLTKKIDVYDLEVSETHNFALAGGVFVHNSAKQGRDRRTQAILPLRGKILNVERARLDRMLGSQEIKNLVIALGTAIGDTFDIEKLRYHKVIIATDADVDGDHIKTLLLTLFYRYFKPIIEGGYLFAAKAPLYKVTQGKKLKYVYSDDEKDEYVAELGGVKVEAEETDEEEKEEGEGENEEEKGERETKDKEKRKQKISIQRYKGLGEMNPDELFETTMDSKNRILKRIFIEDAQAADRTFDILMGSQVAPRKSFIQSNAKIAQIDLNA